MTKENLAGSEKEPYWAKTHCTTLVGPSEFTSICLLPRFGGFHPEFLIGRACATSNYQRTDTRLLTDESNLIYSSCFLPFRSTSAIRSFPFPLPLPRLAFPLPSLPSVRSKSPRPLHLPSQSIAKNESVSAKAHHQASCCNHIEEERGGIRIVRVWGCRWPRQNWSGDRCRVESLSHGGDAPSPRHCWSCPPTLLLACRNRALTPLVVQVRPWSRQSWCLELWPLTHRASWLVGSKNSPVVISDVIWRAPAQGSREVTKAVVLT